MKNIRRKRRKFIGPIQLIKIFAILSVISLALTVVFLLPNDLKYGLHLALSFVSYVVFTILGIGLMMLYLICNYSLRK